MKSISYSLEQTRKILTKQSKILFLSFVFFIIILLVSFSIYSFVFSGKILPNTFIGEINFSKITKSEAESKLSSQIESINGKDIILNYQEKSWQIPFSNLKITYNITESVDTLYFVGRKGNIFQRIKERISVLFTKREMLSMFSYNKTKTDNFFSQVVSEVNIMEKDAVLKYENDQFVIVEEQAGYVVNEKQLESDFKREIGSLADRKLNLQVEKENPKIFAGQLGGIKKQAEKIINDPILLKSEKLNFKVDKKKIASWIDIIAVPVAIENTVMIRKVIAKDDIAYTPKLIFNPEKIKAYVEEIAQDINQDPIDAKLTISGGKATVFVSSQDGCRLNQDKTSQSILTLLQGRQKVAGVNSKNRDSQTETVVDLFLETVEPTVSNETIDNLGIKELIGKGTTNFRGSPANRITNIKVGSSMFNGTLIKPGEIFSTIKTLGEISTSKGYLPELVIKEDTTKPEVGGGLCQVSTTLFRAALNSGLPITERSNHRYRVSYYEPPVGMDATIYDPSPDLKFENNTPGYILIQTSISGNELTFEFYGTKDGRKVEISNPTLYDVVSPGDPIYKEDSSLAPGEVVQKEKAHSGSKASFYYKVTSSSGQLLTEKTFVSSYTPWRAVYLVGPGEAPSENQEQAQSESESSSSPSPTSSPTPSESPTSSPSPSPSST